MQSIRRGVVAFAVSASGPNMKNEIGTASHIMTERGHWSILAADAQEHADTLAELTYTDALEIIIPAPLACEFGW
jgi:hypothetical protein